MSWEDDFDSGVVASLAATNVAAADEVEEVDMALEAAVAPAPVTKPAEPAKPQQVKAKHIAKARQAELAKKAAEEAEAARARLAAEGGPLDDPYAEKRRLEKLQEAHDLALASEFLGGAATGEVGAAAGGAGGKVDVSVRVNAVPLTTEEEFKQFGLAVAKKVNEATGPRSTANAMACYREVLRQAAERLSLDNLSDLIKTLEVAHNRKKQATAPKKAASKKGGRLNIERAGDYDLGSDFADMGGEAAAGTGSAYVDADDFM